MGVRFRLDLEDASQIQIARVVRGIWGRSIASLLRKAAEHRAEARFILNPYHVGNRRMVLQLLRDKYAPLFAAQDVAARVIQRQARKFLRFARLRWMQNGRRSKVISDLVRINAIVAGCHAGWVNSRWLDRLASSARASTDTTAPSAYNSLSCCRESTRRGLSEKRSALASFR